MTELRKMAEELMEMNTISTLGSKVDGRRNWTIRIEHYPDGVKIARIGGQGAMKPWSSEMIMTVIERKIRWFHFTYKKDCKETEKILEENGYTIIHY